MAGEFKITFKIETPNGRHFGLGYDFELPNEPIFRKRLTSCDDVLHKGNQ